MMHKNFLLVTIVLSTTLANSQNIILTQTPDMHYSKQQFYYH